MSRCARTERCAATPASTTHCAEDIHSGLELQVDADTAEATKRITRSACRRIVEFACQYAVRFARRNVTAIPKANVLHLTDGIFLDTVRETAAGYPGLACDEVAIDAACYLMVKDPTRFDVMVAPNQYGEILSGLAAGTSPAARPPG